MKYLIGAAVAYTVLAVLWTFRFHIREFLDSVRIAFSESNPPHETEE